MKEINKSAELALREVIDIIKAVQNLHVYPQSTHYDAHKAKEIIDRNKRKTVEELAELVPDIVNNLFIDAPNR